MRDFDAVVVGGGFYGCCLALYLRSVAARVALVESGEELMRRASRVNQARVHAGFHYPRSFRTAMRSSALQQRFIRDFEYAILTDFDMLYAIASVRSKVTPMRFSRMFQAIGADFQRAPPRLRNLFDPDLVEEVFLCREFAFDWSKLRDDLLKRLDANGVTLFMGTTVQKIEGGGEKAVVHTDEAGPLTAESVFNVTYANVNAIPLASKLPAVPVKHELAEVALIEPPEELAGLAVTLMDGPFFSVMPFPAEGLYSLTHVRYTPHFSWVDSGQTQRIADALPKETRYRYMLQDASRFLRCLEAGRYSHSYFDVKTVLTKNEENDGRPILLHRYRDAPRVFSILGAKVDNIYDLFDMLPQIDAKWKNAHTGLLCHAH